MTEAELAMEEKLRRKREEEKQLWDEYVEQRDAQRRKEEEDLKKLKERQVGSLTSDLSLQNNELILTTSCLKSTIGSPKGSTCRARASDA